MPDNNSKHEPPLFVIGVGWPQISHVYVVDKDDVVHRREIVVQNEMDYICVIKKGVGVGDRIVLEGIRQVHDDEKVTYEFRPPEEVIGKLKTHAE